MRRGLVAAALIIGTALGGVSAPAVLSGAPACAAATGPHAGLVVVTSGGTSTFCVALDAAEVSGLHLIELAHDQDGLSYSFGFGGQAVCQLGGVGPSGGDCFADYPDFWGYWHGDGSGGWTWASTGAGSARIGDGDLDGWVWGSATRPRRMTRRRRLGSTTSARRPRRRIRRPSRPRRTTVRAGARVRGRAVLRPRRARPRARSTRRPRRRRTGTRIPAVPRTRRRHRRGAGRPPRPARA